VSSNEWTKECVLVLSIRQQEMKCQNIIIVIVVILQGSSNTHTHIPAVRHAISPADCLIYHSSHSTIPTKSRKQGDRRAHIVKHLEQHFISTSPLVQTISNLWQSRTAWTGSNTNSDARSRYSTAWPFRKLHRNTFLEYTSSITHILHITASCTRVLWLKWCLFLYFLSRNRISLMARTKRSH